MDLVVATVSGYHGSERFKLIKLISQAGASYVGAMNSSTTHLVCHKFEGKKYELAKKCKTIVVNHRWIEECIKQGRRVSERPYMKQCGYEVGPLLLEIPNAASEVRSVLGEVSNNRNFSKTPVIDIECGDDEWTDSWLLKENLLPDTRQNKDRSNRLKRKGTKRCSKQDDLLKNKYCLEESPSFGLKSIEKRKNTTIGEPSRRNRRLMHKNIYNELSSSESEGGFKHSEIHQNDIEISEPSNYSRKHDHGKRRNLILEEIEDLGTTSSREDHSTEVDHDDCYKMERNPRLSKETLLSCVICWTEYSSTRGVLPCGHRFCFSCIQNWADHMASMKKVSTCPLCKAKFYSIQKMQDAESSDQKIYSQTIPNNCPLMDVYIIPHGESSIHQNMPPPTPVCYQCSCREPEELLISCHRCQIRCVHSYCLDPPQIPWVCVQCKDLRMRYIR
ncbi:putative chromatin regulator PHD family [Helianthus debilis subsp. tardiflorus]